MKLYERIKKMNLKEMAEHHARFERAVVDAALTVLGLEIKNYPPLKVSIKNMEEWLQIDEEK